MSQTPEEQEQAEFVEDATTPPPSLESQVQGAERKGLVKLMMKIAEIGNKLPDPLTLFVLLAVMVIVLSVVFSGAEADVVQRDGTTSKKVVLSLLTGENIRWMLTSAVKNFINFAPLGPVLAVMIGIGVAERTGFITMGLKMLVRSVPSSLLTATLVFSGVMSSMVADAGYVVLTPLGAVLFAGLGRHPIAGLAAAFAGVSGGFSANLLITGLDPLLSKLTQSAAATIDPQYAATINATCNYYFMIASVFLITIVGTLVTKRIVEPMLGKWDPSDGDDVPTSAEGFTPEERSAFFKALAAGIATLVGIALLVVPEGAPLRDVVKEGAPSIDQYHHFFESIEILITALFFVPGVVYGVLVGKIKNDKDIAQMASAAMSAMGAYIVLAFVAGQFVAFFNHTNLGSVTAVKGAGMLKELGLTGVPLMLAFIVVSATMNLFVGSASAKWAFMAPIFVPMLMLSGLSPASVQAAYRVGDSVTNIISPLMPYLPIIIIFAKKYDRKAGLGTLISAMLPYSVAFGIAWTVMLIVWYLLGMPLGPEAPMLYEAMQHVKP